MLLEMLFARCDQLQGDELVAAVFETGDDGTDESALDRKSARCSYSMLWCAYLDTIWLNGNETEYGVRLLRDNGSKAWLTSARST